MSTEGVALTRSGSRDTDGARMGGRLVALLLAGLLAGCQGASSESTAAPEQAPDAAPAPVASAAVDAPPPAWLRFETPADAAGADVEALPLSPYRAGKLAEDVAERAKAAGGFTSRRTVVVADTFVLAMADPAAPLDAAADTVRRETAFLWRGKFARRLYEGVTIWVYGTRAAYEAKREKYGPKDSVAGDLSFYDPDTRSIWFCAEGSGLGTLGHETAHPLIQGGYGDGDFPHAPVWLAEGLAALFEVVTYDEKTGDARFGAHFRIKSLRTALKRSDYAPKVTLEHLFTLRDDKSFKQDRELDYALARETLRFIYEKHGDALWRFYRSWRDGIITDPTGERAFASSMDGKTPADVTPEFLAWVQSSESGPL